MSSIFNISLPTGRLATAIAWRQVGVDVNHLVGMGVKWGSLCHMSIIRNVCLPVDFKKGPCCTVDFK